MFVGALQVFLDRAFQALYFKIHAKHLTGALSGDHVWKKASAATWTSSALIISDSYFKKFFINVSGRHQIIFAIHLLSPSQPTHFWRYVFRKTVSLRHRSPCICQEPYRNPFKLVKNVTHDRDRFPPRTNHWAPVRHCERYFEFKDHVEMKKRESPNESWLYRKSLSHKQKRCSSPLTPCARQS